MWDDVIVLGCIIPRDDVCLGALDPWIQTPTHWEASLPICAHPGGGGRIKWSRTDEAPWSSAWYLENLDAW